ncbi:MAG: PEP-CTERM sorting domain-containing protein [Deltaproteobacteria bacterium]
MRKLIPLALLLIIFLAKEAGAVSYMASYTVNFEPGSEPFSSGRLEGGIDIFYTLQPPPDDQRVILGHSNMTSLGPGERYLADSFFDVFFELSGPDAIYLWMSFAGSGVSGPLDAPVFWTAFAFGPESPVTPPPDDMLPAVFIGTLAHPPDPGMPMVLPIYGFASPGTYIGSLEVAVSNVPEPSTLLLLGSGMIGLAMTRFRKFRKKG